MTNLDHLHEQLRGIVGPDAPFVFVLVSPDDPASAGDDGIGQAGAAIVVQGMTALQVAATLVQLVPPCLADVARERNHDHLVERLRGDLEHLDPGDLGVSTVDELLRAIEDAIDAHVRDYPAGPEPLDGEQGTAVLRAVLEAGWRPTDRTLDVCRHCRGTGTRQWTGETYRAWCRDCRGTGYLERTE